MGQNRIIRAKKASVEGQSPPEELEVGRRSWPYLLVYIINNIDFTFLWLVPFYDSALPVSATLVVNSEDCLWSWEQSFCSFKLTQHQIFKILNFGNPILDTRISVRTSPSFVTLSVPLPPWILKRAGLEISGQRIISSLVKTKTQGFLSVPLLLRNAQCMPPPLDSETDWTGELWSKTNLFNWENKENNIFLPNIIFFKIFRFLETKCFFFNLEIF